MKRLPLSKKILAKKYIQEKKSSRQIAKETGWSKSTVVSKLKEYNIRVRSNTELRKGMKFNLEWRKNISKRHADVSGADNPMYGVRRFGKDNPGWQGGKTQLIQLIRNLNKYYEWRLTVFKRDNFICQKCSKNSDGDMEADHIVPLSHIVDINNIISTDRAFDCNDLWDVNNGRTLCSNCHKNTSTWGSKAKKYKNMIE